MKTQAAQVRKIRTTYPFLLQLCFIIPSYVVSLFIKPQERSKLFSFPKIINEYYFIRKISLKTYPFAVGLYKTKNNELFVMKFWRGFMRDMYYFSFLHEYETLKILEDLVNKYSTKIPNYYKRIFFPTVVSIIAGNGYVVTVRKYIPGVISKKVNVSQQQKLYGRVVGYLHILSDLLNNNERKRIKSKNWQHFVVIFPLIFLASLWRNHQYRKELTIAAVKFFLLFPYLVKEDKTLVHGDLHNENLLVTKRGVCILDCEQMMLTYPAYEYITTIASFRTVGVFKDYVWNQLFNNKTKKRFRYLTCLIINNSIHNLTGTTLKKSIKKNIYLLKIALSQNYSFLQNK